jgi:hypothetical protein
LNGFLVVELLLLYKAEEARMRHVYLAAHFDERLTGRESRSGMERTVLQVRGDVLADGRRRRALSRASAHRRYVFERHRQSVNFRFDRIDDVLARLAYAGAELEDYLARREHVLRGSP